MASLRRSAATFGHGATWKLGFIALMYVDVALTLAATQVGYAEMNPLMAGMLASPWRLIVFKGFVPIAIAWLVPDRLLLPSIGFMIGVAGWNLKELLLGL